MIITNSHLLFFLYVTIYVQHQNDLQGSGRGDGGVRPPSSHQRGGTGFGWCTLAFVAVLFFFLGHWLDFASAGGGGRSSSSDGGFGSSGGGVQGVGTTGFGKNSAPGVMRAVAGDSERGGEGKSYLGAAASAGLSTPEDAAGSSSRDG